MTDPAIVAALNNARAAAKSAGKDVHAGNLKDYESFASTYSNLAPTPQGSPGVQQTTTSTRTQAAHNATTLSTYTAGVANANTANTGQGTVSVLKDMDNGDGTRTVTYSDGSSARVTSTKNSDGSESYKEVDGSQRDADATDADELTGQVDAASAYAKKQSAYINKTLDGMLVQGDAITQMMIQQLKTEYAGRAVQMKDTNARKLAGETTNELRTGRARYSPEMSGGILEDEEQSGILRLGELQVEMYKAIFDAQKAQQDEELDIFNSRIDKLKDVRTEMNGQIKDLYDRAEQKRKDDLDEAKANLDMTKTSLDINESKATDAAATIAEKMKGLATAEDKAAFLHEYSNQTGIPVENLMSALDTFSTKKAKDSLDLENTRSLINSRYLSDSKTRKEIAKMNDDDEDGPEIRNIVNGVSTLADVDAKKKEAVKAKLEGLGLYDDTPPSWFVQGKNAEANADLTGEKLKELWDAYRTNATGGG